MHSEHKKFAEPIKNIRLTLLKNIDPFLVKINSFRSQDEAGNTGAWKGGK